MVYSQFATSLSLSRKESFIERKPQKKKKVIVSCLIEVEIFS